MDSDLVMNRIKTVISYICCFYTFKTLSLKLFGIRIKIKIINYIFSYFFYTSHGVSQETYFVQSADIKCPLCII